MADYKTAGVQDVLDEARTYIKNEDSLSLISRAANYAAEAHAGQFRRSGEPYTVHLNNVAYILATLHGGPKTIAAGFLHDVIEDTGISRDQLAKIFDDEIADLVESVTKIGALQFKGKDDPEYQAANHRKIFIAMAKDVRVILIKLADRLHNMRTLEYQPEASQKRIAAETLDVYAPIAHRLGISAIKNELEDLSFFYLNRKEYYRIAHLVEARKAERDESVRKMIAEISEMLEEHGISFRIFGRSKHLYSIYHKMVARNKRFEEILDLLAIRIVTETELNCYEVLGYIHAKYKPIPGRLKDYIAVPKTNMYQSLHTTIIGEEGKIFEVQIRTEDMDAIAERGVAAHWRYKEGGHYDARAEQKEIEDKLSWFRDFAVYSNDNEDETASDYMAALQKDVFEANVYVMTPKGRVIGLPNGSTPIDFAYRIHTDVGHTCVGALVNDAMVPLNTELHTGDVVSIRTLKGTGPSEDWLKFVKTSQAKNKIRAWFAKRENEKRESMVDQGEKVLTEELRRRGFEPKDYMEKKKLEAIMKEFSAKDYTDLMYGIAMKLINPTAVCEKLTNQKRSLNDEEALTKLINRETKKHVMTKTGIIVPGIESMKLSLAQCCLPVYGDKIVGYVTKGEGVKVHRCDCANVAGQKERIIDCYWEEEDNERLYDSDISILAEDRNFLLTDIVNYVSQARAPMLKVSANVNQADLTTTIKLRIQIHNVEQLDTLIANLRKVDGVITVKRASH